MVEVERYDRAVSIRHEIGLGDENLLITFIGQISEIKGIDLFLELAKKIESKNVRFLIAGSCKDPKKFKGGYSHEKLLGLIRSDPRIHYLGRRSDVENVYKSSDIIVMPSRWDEPFGLVNIEAGAAGKPIVATKVGGISEIIENGDNGFLVERDDIAAMTNIVCNLMNSRDLRERIGIRARAVVEEKFTRAPARKLESIYQNMSVKN